MNDDQPPRSSSVQAAHTGVTGLKLILAAFLVAVNAFFVIAEYALVRSRRARLEVMQEEGQRGARARAAINSITSTSTSRLSRSGSRCLDRIGALGAPTLAHALEEAIGGTLSHGVVVAISVVLAYVS